MNTFFRWVDNPISICAKGAPFNKKSYTIDGDGEIIKTKHGLIVTGLKNR